MAHVAQKVSTSEAASFMGRFRLVDPFGRETLADALAGADCFEVQTKEGRAVFAARLCNGFLWVSAAAGQGEVFNALCDAVEGLAKRSGAARVGFQTGRRGLVKKAAARGYTGNGIILEKAIL